MSFRMAASLAFKKGMKEANPVLLEPIYSIEIMVPEEYMGDIMGDLNKKRVESRAWSPWMASRRFWQKRPCGAVKVRY